MSNISKNDSSWRLIMKVKFWIIFIFFLTIKLNSNSIIKVGYLTGKFHPTIEQRIFIDDLIQNEQIGRINSNWSKKYPYVSNIYFEIQYVSTFPKSKEGNHLVFRGGFYGLDPLVYQIYKFYGFSFSPFLTLSFVELKRFRENSFLDGDMGYKIKIKDFSLTPKVGTYFNVEGFKFKEIKIGQESSMSFKNSLGNNEFFAFTSSNYLGIDLEIPFKNNFSFLGEYINSAFPNSKKHGKMEFKTSTLLFSENILAMKITNQTSLYNIKIERIKLGILYDLDKIKHIEFGIRKEIGIHSYPKYFQTFFFISNKEINFEVDPLAEILSDYIFWKQEKKQIRELLYFAFQYDFLN